VQGEHVETTPQIELGHLPKPANVTLIAPLRTSSFAAARQPRFVLRLALSDLMTET
jgi:hypothetical protein